MTAWTTVALHGPNRWSPCSVLELHAPMSLTDIPSRVAEPIATCLESFLDSGRFTTTHPESKSIARQRVAAIRTATHFGRLWASVAGWMSAMAGVPSEFFWPVIGASNSATEDDSKDDLRAITALTMEEELLSRRCYEMAKELIDTFESQAAYPIAIKFRELFDYADDVRLGPSSRAILDAASARSIPYYRMTRGSLVQLGEGRYQRRIWTAETDATSAIAESIASDKDLTKRLLRNVGVPVPLGRMVTSPEDALAAAEEVGLPVVVKPRNANHQRGISLELMEREEIIKAYHWAIEDGQTNDVMVEQYALGRHHRLLVVGDSMVAACRGHFDTATGDGIRSIRQLVDEINQDPRRGEAYNDPLSVVKIDASVVIELAKQGLTPDSIPEDGQFVLVQRNGDLTTDCTEEVHPEIARQAVLAARVIGLDIAGLDILATDIREPLEGQRGAVVEVNAGPSLSPHVTPLFGKPQPVGDAIIDMLYPQGSPFRVVIVAVLASATSGTRHRTQRIVKEYAEDGLVVGCVEAGEIRVDDHCIELQGCSISDRVQAVLGHPTVDVLVIEIDPKLLGRASSPVPRIDRLVIDPSVVQDVDRTYCNDAWRTLAHALTRDTTVDWTEMPDGEDRTKIKAMLGLSHSD